MNRCMLLIVKLIENISTFSITIFEFAIFLILLCKVWISLKVSMGVEYQFTTVRFVCFSFDLVFRNPLIMSYVTAAYFFTAKVLSLLLSFSLLDTPLYWICIFKSQFLSILKLSVGDTHHKLPHFYSRDILIISILLHCFLVDKIEH